MMQGLSGSLETFCTFPPTAKARPDGVRSGCDALGTLGRWETVGLVGKGTLEPKAGCGGGWAELEPMLLNLGDGGARECVEV